MIRNHFVRPCSWYMNILRPSLTQLEYVLCLSNILPPHLDSWSYLLRQLHVQAFLAGVQTVDHLLVLQLARADHQPRKVPPEKLSHPSISAWVRQDGDEGEKTTTHIYKKKKSIYSRVNSIDFTFSGPEIKACRLNLQSWREWRSCKLVCIPVQGPRPSEGDGRMVDELTDALETCNICINKVNHVFEICLEMSTQQIISVYMLWGESILPKGKGNIMLCLPAEP